MAGSMYPVIRPELQDVAARSAVDTFVSISSCPTDDPAEVLGQLLAALRNHHLRRYGSDAVWGDSVRVMQRALQE